MKKFACALFVASIAVTPTVFAEALAIPDTGEVKAGAAGDCKLLSEDVKINLSSNVSGALNCDVATNTITIGTCHNAGSRLASLKCAQIGTDPNSNAPIFNDDGCTSAMVAAGESIEGTPDFRGFFAQTSGGSVAPAFLGGTCTADALKAHAKLGN